MSVSVQAPHRDSSVDGARALAVSIGFSIERSHSALYSRKIAAKLATLSLATACSRALASAALAPFASASKKMRSSAAFTLSSMPSHVARAPATASTCASPGLHESTRFRAF